MPKFDRVLLKLSGESLQGDNKYGIDQPATKSIADEIKKVVTEFNTEIAIVIGGGNIFRGISGAANNMDRANADYMGMLATVINALALQDALEKVDVATRVQTAIEMNALAEAYIRRRALRHLEKGRVVIFAAGTGSPYFTTDTAAALRAMEIHADIILKATKVNGVYDKDPIKYTNAKKIDYLTHLDVLKNNLKVIDSTAISLCRDNDMPLMVFDITQKGNIYRSILGENIGTLIDTPSLKDIDSQNLTH